MPSDLDDLELRERFQRHVEEYCDRSEHEADYNPIGLRGMLGGEGRAVGAVCRLLDREKPAPGFYELEERDHLHLSMEALVHENPQYHKLFTPSQRANAMGWLDEAGYFDKKD